MSSSFLPEDYEAEPILGYATYDAYSRVLPRTAVFLERPEGEDWVELPTWTDEEFGDPPSYTWSFKSGDTRYSIGRARSPDGLVWAPATYTGGRGTCNFHGRPILWSSTYLGSYPNRLLISHNLGASYVDVIMPEIPGLLTWGDHVWVTYDGIIHYVSNHLPESGYSTTVRHFYHWMSEDLGNTWTEPHEIATTPVPWEGGQIRQSSGRGPGGGTLCALDNMVCFVYVEGWTEQYYNRMGAPGNCCWDWYIIGGHHNWHEPTYREGPRDLIVFISDDYGVTWSRSRLKSDTGQIDGAPIGIGGTDSWGGAIAGGIGGSVGDAWGSALRAVPYDGGCSIIWRTAHSHKHICVETHEHSGLSFECCTNEPHRLENVLLSYNFAGWSPNNSPGKYFDYIGQASQVDNIDKGMRVCPTWAATNYDGSKSVMIGYDIYNYNGPYDERPHRAYILHENGVNKIELLPLHGEGTTDWTSANFSIPPIRLGGSFWW